MRTFIAFLRGINVGGHRKMKMVELRALFEAENCTSVKTYLQSGNVIFSSDADPADLEIRLEDAIEDMFSYDVKVLLRTQSDLEELIDENPFLSSQRSEEERKKLYFILLKTKVGIETWNGWVGPGNEDEARILASPRSGAAGCVYLFCKKGYGKTKINNAYFEKKFSVHASARNLKTILALRSMLAER